MVVSLQYPGHATVVSGLWRLAPEAAGFKCGSFAVRCGG
tara:strand:+ start:2694 stop:2810 length:117 start_codon:yes stop_codon:yes gene_type:complete